MNEEKPITNRDIATILNLHLRVCTEEILSVIWLIMVLYSVLTQAWYVQVFTVLLWIGQTITYIKARCKLELIIAKMQNKPEEKIE